MNSGMFTDGSFNTDYRCLSQCLWLMEPLIASQFVPITVTVDFCDIEESYDFLYFFDGSDTDSALITQLSGEYSNYTFTSSGPLVLAYFTSDTSVTRSGFDVSYKAGIFILNVSDNSFMWGCLYGIFGNWCV